MSTIIRPEVVEERERAEHNMLQAERRRVALDILCSLMRNATTDSVPVLVEDALKLADKLIEKTEFKK